MGNCNSNNAFMPIFSFLPMPSIAAVLVVAAVRMVPYAFLRSLWRRDRAGLSRDLNPLLFSLPVSAAAVCVRARSSTA